MSCLAPLLASMLLAAPAAQGAEAAPGEKMEKVPGKPPRVDGIYFGANLDFGAAFARTQNLEIDNPHYGAWGGLRVGQSVLPWLSLGVEGSGGVFFYPDEQLWQGGAMFTPAFYPVPRYPFSILLGLGFGAGFVRDDALDMRDGFGGPLFMAALRYEFFPGADKRRPDRAGGFTIGPELGWRGFTPAGPGQPGQPMANTVFIGLWIAHYWGR